MAVLAVWAWPIIVFLARHMRYTSQCGGGRGLWRSTLTQLAKAREDKEGARRGCK